jgi:heme exporter protein A
MGDLMPSLRRSDALASPPALETRGLCRRYGRRWALVEVDLAVPRGAFLLLTGRNGSGKSTLLKVVATALAPHRGTVRVAGHDVVAARDEVRRSVALLGHASHLYEDLTALENLRVPARFLGLGTTRDELVGRLEAVGLAGRADDPVASFSAGMRKRLSLARTLLQDAEVLLLDEPYGNLDPPGFEMVDRQLEAFRARGATVVLATHLLERGRTTCDLGVVLEEGRVAWSGPAGDLRLEPAPSGRLAGALP